jgi:hypothetical protein
MMPLPQGSARGRNPFMFRDFADSRNARSRLFTFVNDVNDDIIVEVGDSMVIVRNQFGKVQQGAISDILTDGNFRQRLATWSIDFYSISTDEYGPRINIPGSDFPARSTFDPPLPSETPFLVFFTGKDYNPDDAFGTDSVSLMFSTEAKNYLENGVSKVVRIRETLSTSTIVSTPSPGKPHRLRGSVVLTTETGFTGEFDDLSLKIKVGPTLHSNSYYEAVVPITRRDDMVTIDVTFTPPSDEFYIEIHADINPASSRNYKGWTKASGINNIPPFNLMTVRTLSLETEVPGPPSSLEPVEFLSPWQASKLSGIKYAMDSAERELWFFHPEVEPHRLKVEGVGWTFKKISDIVDYKQPAPGIWGAGWPSCGCFHESRLWLGGAPGSKSTVVASRVGVYSDFDTTSVDDAADPLNFPLTAPGGIKWIESNQALIIGTDRCEVVGSGSRGPITFDDFNFKINTYWGSADIQAALVGRQIVYVSPSKDRVRTISLMGNDSGWDGIELSILNPDIFDSKIQEVHFAGNPGYQLLCVMGNGTICGSTYLYNENKVGWYRVETRGAVLSATPARTSDGDELWVVVNRQGIKTIESYKFSTFDKFALDRYVKKQVTESGLIEGLPYIDGSAVSVVLTGKDPVTQGTYYQLHPSMVVEGGSIQLEGFASGSVAYIGIPYEQRIISLKPEGVTPRGSSQQATMKWNKVFLRLNDSSVPKINGKSIADRSAETPMDTSEPFVTADVNITPVGWGDGELDIFQPMPLIVEISGIFGRLGANEGS